MTGFDTTRLDPADRHVAGADVTAVDTGTVQGAIVALRRGEPVWLCAAAKSVPPLVVLAAEAASAGGIARYRELAPASGVLLMSPMRAAAIVGAAEGDGVQALALAPGHLIADVLRALADPTVPQTWPSSPGRGTAPDGAADALALVKIAHLLPACLAAPVRGEPPADIARVAAADVLAYPAGQSAGLRRVAEASVPLADAPNTRIVAFRPPDGGVEHLAILVGRPEEAEVPLVRVHSECFTGDLLGSLRCDCGPQLRTAITRMAQDGAGALIYLAQEGRGIGLANKLRAYTLQDRGMDTVDANRALGWAVDERTFAAAAVMLRALGIGRVRLLTNNPQKVAALAACGIEVVARVSLIVASNGVNDAYLAAKAARLGHWLDR